MMTESHEMPKTVFLDRQIRHSSFSQIRNNWCFRYWIPTLQKADVKQMCIHKCKQTYLEQLVICTSRSSFALINSCHQRRQLPVIFLLGFKYLLYHLEWIRFVAHSVSIWCFSCCHHFHFNGLKPLNNKKNPLKMFSSFQLHALSHILPTSTLPLPLC